MLNRRELMQRALMTAAIPRSCCSTPTAPPDSTSFEGGRVEIDLAKAKALRPAGGSVKIVNPERGVDIIVAHVAKKQFAAWDRACTHGGVQVTYDPEHRTVMCTSWGHSEFDLQGNVLRGSAREPLRAYRVVLSDNRLLIDLEAKP